MPTLAKVAITSGAFIVMAAAWPALAQDLKGDRSWDDVVSKKRSVVLGRFDGQFSGPQFKKRRIKLLEVGSDKSQFLDVADGLGYIEEFLPPGQYRIVGIEATYFPHGTGMDPLKFRPVKQRFFVTPKGEEKFPTFEVPADRPVYIGTITAGVDQTGIVHKGHNWRVLDEYEQTLARIEEIYPKFAASLSQRGIEPVRSYVLKPTRSKPVLEFIGVEDPIEKSRAYIEEGKYESAINWLATFLPSSDAERLESQLLIGEALLAQEMYDDAIDRLGEVLQAAPDKTRALRLLARAHALAGNLEDAQSLFEALVELHPEDTEAHLQLGYLYAISSDHQRSQQEFRSAFSDDTDYLLHDAAPFVVALRAVRAQDAYYEPPVAKKEIARPNWIRSRKDSEESGLALLIDHEGNVVAAQLSGSGQGPLPLMLMAIVRADFVPAAVNGVPVPAVLALPGGPSTQ